MREIETKLLNVDHDEILPKIESYVKERCGELIKTFEGTLDAIYYSAPDNTTVRLRRKNNNLSSIETSELTVKSPRSSFYKEFKTCDEINIDIDSFEDGEKLLDILGHKENRKISKTRISYEYNDIRFEFDIINGNLKWLEVEAPLEEDIVRIVEYLGFDISDCCNKSQLKLYDEIVVKELGNWTLDKGENENVQ